MKIIEMPINLDRPFTNYISNLFKMDLPVKHQD